MKTQKNKFYLLSTKYPTKEKIMEKQIKFRKETIAAVKKWKEKYTPLYKLKREQRFQALQSLVKTLENIYEKPISTVVYKKNLPSYCYDPMARKIYMNKRLSIISTLHEFGHHLFGSSETQACRWSVQLFKKVFPENFSKLKWIGHQLVKTKK